ncbi:hypothetical protein LJC35_06830 [Parabacteroides sp. OttesenSCG-928-N08]|nr:hypothetical protein [Parabacteroides sp. OttesenSCG-928-N08]
MKRIYIILLLTILSFSTFTAKAQEKRLNEQQTKELFQALFPAIFQQMRWMTGIDVLAFTQKDADAESMIYAHNYQPFGASLRTAGNEMTVFPERIVIDSNGLGLSNDIINSIGNVILKMSDPQYLTLYLNNQPIRMGIPAKITVNFSKFSAIKDAITLGMSVTQGEGPLPIGSLSFEVKKLNALLSLVTNIIDIPIKKGKWFSLTERDLGDGRYAYTLLIEEGLKNLLGDEAESLSDMMLLADISAMESDRKMRLSLHDEPLLGETTRGMVELYLKEGASGVPAMSESDSVIVYNYQGGEITGYTRYDMTATKNNKKLIAKESRRLQPTDSWIWAATQTVVMPEPTMLFTLDEANLYAILHAALQQGTTGMARNYTLTSKKESHEMEQRVMQRVESRITEPNSLQVTAFGRNDADELTATQQLNTTFDSGKQRLDIALSSMNNGVAMQQVAATISIQGERETVTSPRYEVDFLLPDAGITLTKPSQEKVTSGEDYPFTLQLDPQYLNSELLLLVNDQPTAFTFSDRAKGEYSHTLSHLQENMLVEVVMTSDPTSSPLLTGTPEVLLATAPNTLIIQTTTLEEVTIFNIIGQVVHQERLHGTHHLPLRPGFYLVKIGEMVRKVEIGG